MYLMLLYIDSKNEIRRLDTIWNVDIFFFLRKHKWRNKNVITNSSFMKFKHKSTKDISKRHIEFQFETHLKLIYLGDIN